MGKSGLRRYANRRDEAEADIVEYLRKAGCSVYLMDKPCDLIVLHMGSVYLVEVKTGKRGKLTEAQTAFRAIWPLHILRSVEDAMFTVNLWRRKAAA